MGPWITLMLATLRSAAVNAGRQLQLIFRGIVAGAAVNSVALFVGLCAATIGYRMDWPSWITGGMFWATVCANAAAVLFAIVVWRTYVLLGTIAAGSITLTQIINFASMPIPGPTLTLAPAIDFARVDKAVKAFMSALAVIAAAGAWSVFVPVYTNLTKFLGTLMLFWFLGFSVAAWGGSGWIKIVLQKGSMILAGVLIAFNTLMFVYPDLRLETLLTSCENQKSQKIEAKMIELETQQDLATIERLSTLILNIKVAIPSASPEVQAEREERIQKLQSQLEQLQNSRVKTYHAGIFNWATKGNAIMAILWLIAFGLPLAGIGLAIAGKPAWGMTAIGIVFLLSMWYGGDYIERRQLPDLSGVGRTITLATSGSPGMGASSGSSSNSCQPTRTGDTITFPACYSGKWYQIGSGQMTLNTSGVIDHGGKTANPTGGSELGICTQLDWTGLPDCLPLAGLVVRVNGTKPFVVKNGIHLKEWLISLSTTLKLTTIRVTM